MFAEYPDVLTIDEIRSALGIGKSLAYRLINNGNIKHFRIGKYIKVPKRFLIDYVLGECYTDTVATSIPSVKFEEVYHDRECS